MLKGNEPAMKLFEAINGSMGCSYVRMYVWAVNKDQAKELAEVGGMLRDRIEIKELMDSKDKAFCTEISDEGWEHEP